MRRAFSLDVRKFPMKINVIPVRLALFFCAAAAMFAFSQNARALSIGDTQTIGYVFYGIPSGDQDRTNYVNHLVYMYNNGITDDVALGQNFHMVNGAPSFGASMQNAVFGVNGTGTSINLGMGCTPTFLRNMTVRIRGL